ncbi:hypothetical protein DH2020_018349 [Rehmannia glutinosa]|uniref:AP180 N-terminal homology (ANTH) domain-containing protein n=1 Tax=Rehmannia glutinosa TaxID=99300 RepID=A0ABR0WIS5_REHGL
MESFRKAYGALKDTTKVGLANLNSEFKVAVKTLVVIHRTLREGDPTFREELLQYSHRGKLFQISNFKDDSSPLATGIATASIPSDLLPGAACINFLIQYALALVLKESFKIYCSINDGIINLVDMFFEMPKHDAVRALNIYKKAGKQAEHLADFYGFCRTLDLARTFHFPTLRQPPPTFLATMEEYIKEAPQTGSLSHKRLEYRETEQEPQEDEKPAPEETEKTVEEVENKEEMVELEEEAEPQIIEEVPQPESAQEPDLLGLNIEVNPEALRLEESNALALAILQPGDNLPSANNALAEIGKTSGWELALVTTPSNINKPQVSETKMAGGFDKLLLDSLYEDDAARRTVQLHSAGYNTSYGYEMAPQTPFDQQYDPFAMSNNIAPPTNVQMAMMSQQEQIMMLQQQQQQQQAMMMVPHNPYTSHYSPQQMPQIGPSNPFGDPFSYPQSGMPPHGNNTLI